MKIDLEMFLARAEVAFPVIGRSSQIILPHPRLPVSFYLKRLQRNRKRRRGQQPKGEHSGQVCSKKTEISSRGLSLHSGLCSTEIALAWQSVAW